MSDEELEREQHEMQSLLRYAESEKDRSLVDDHLDALRKEIERRNKKKQ